MAGDCCVGRFPHHRLLQHLYMPVYCARNDSGYFITHRSPKFDLMHQAASKQYSWFSGFRAEAATHRLPSALIGLATQ